MAYECQNFKDGQVLTAECLNKIEKALEAICNKEITSAHLNDNSELVFVFCNGAELNTGVVIGSAESGTASSAVSTHNTDTTAHADIREQISQLSSATSKVFIATYGVTTTAAVLNAYNNGQRIICHYTTEHGEYVYAELSRYTDDLFIFATVGLPDGTQGAFILDEADGWEYSEKNPVTSVNGKTGAVTVAVPTKVSELTNDAGYLTLSNLPKYDGGVS